MPSTAKEAIEIVVRARILWYRLRNGMTTFNTDWTVIRWLAAIVLLVAALLKVYELATTPTIEGTWLPSRGPLLALVHGELTIAIWLASGMAAFAARRVSICLFGVFSVVSLTSALHVDGSCGCFGGVDVAPSFVVFLDIAFVIALWCAVPRNIEHNDPRRSHHLFTAIAVWICLSAVAITGSLGVSSETLGEGSRLTGSTGVVVLKPQEWIGKTCPLLDYMRVDVDLRTDEWIIVFHQHSCLECLEVIPEIAERAVELHKKRMRPRVAFVEIPPLEHPTHLHMAPQDAYASGTLSDGIEWFIRTPIMMRLREGIVTSVEESEFAAHLEQ